MNVFEKRCCQAKLILKPSCWFQLNFYYMDAKATHARVASARWRMCIFQMIKLLLLMISFVD